MPFRLLERLFAAQFPLCVDDEEDIDKLFVLSATGMLEAEIPKRCRASGPHRYEGIAVVTRMTEQGRAAVNKRASLQRLQREPARWPHDRMPMLRADGGNQRLPALQHQRPPS